MATKGKILSLILVILMMMAAAITVKKCIFGHSLEKSAISEERASATSDTIIFLPDGTAVIHTSAMPGTIDGYAGPVPLDIYISDDKISDIKVLSNSETPSFFRRAAELIDQWIGRTPSEALEMKVDAVSGATFSSNAIISNVNAGLAHYQKTDNKLWKHTPWGIWAALAVTLAACILPLFVKNKVYHNAQLIANVIVLGFWCGQFLDYSLMLKYLSDGFTLPAGLVAITMLIAAFIYPLFGKPQHYCIHICPLGSAQQLMANICGHKMHISKKALHGLDWFRKILWAAFMLLLWADCLTGWMDLELFQAFQFESASWWITGAAILFVALSALITRPYCRFVCPTGSLFKRAENLG